MSETMQSDLNGLSRRSTMLVVNVFHVLCSVNVFCVLRSIAVYVVCGSCGPVQRVKEATSVDVEGIDRAE